MAHAALTAGGLVVGGALVLLLGMHPTLGLIASGGLLIVVSTVLWPAPAVILYMAASPLLVGLYRGALVPGLRLNEILLVPVAAGLGLVLLDRWRRAAWRVPAGFHVLDVVVFLVAFTSSVTTLLWMYARARPISGEDVQYSLAVWKLAVLYALVRLFLRSARTVRTMLLATLATACVVGVIGTLQAVGVGPVIDFVATLVPVGDDGYEVAGSRATSTVGNPIGYGDLLVFASVVAAALALCQPRRRVLLWSAAAALALSALASGSFSTVVALVVAGIVFALVTRTGQWLTWAAIVLGPVAFVGLQPVIAGRLDSLDPDTGLPVSWTDRYGRLDNLERYFWPRLGEDFNWLLGVRPASRVPGEVREWVYIESGYTWALWNGGLPLLAAVIALLAVAFLVGRRLASSGDPVATAMGVALSVVPCVLAVLLLFDPHLTLRGGAEFLFLLLGMGATLDVMHREGRLPSGTAQTSTTRGSR
jgi:hypothetical protein